MILRIVLAALFVGMLAAAAFGQKPFVIKIADIHVTPFESETGKFQAEWTGKDERFFWNDLDVSLFVVVEVSGVPGGFTPNQKIVISALEGRKLKASTTQFAGVFNEQGKFFVPFLIPASICSEIKITARVTGQRTASSKTRSIPFNCGE